MISSLEEFVRLRLSEDPGEYGRANHEDASDEVWIEVYEKHPDMRKYIAYNSTVNERILGLLARDEDPSVRYAVARHMHAGPAVLKLLARDPDETVRSAVAWNQTTSYDILVLLKDDSFYMVREKIKDRLAAK